MNKVIVCPPIYNEKNKVKSVIERFLQSKAYQKVDYLIVDDASTDGTSEVIQGYEKSGVKTIRHPQRRGVGGAIKTAMTYALEQGYEILVIMAGNDKDDPNQILDVAGPVLNGECDFVQGSRYLKKQEHFGDMPFYRRIATKIHPWLMSFITRHKVTDSTNGFRAMRASLFKDPRIDWHQDWLDTYELEPYLLYKTIVLGYKYKEVPVTKIYPPRQTGYTKMAAVTGWWSILRPLIYLGLGLKK